MLPKEKGNSQTSGSFNICAKTHFIETRLMKSTHIAECHILDHIKAMEGVLYTPNSKNPSLNLISCHESINAHRTYWNP